MLLIGVGSKSAFSELYKRYHKKLHFYFCKSLQYDSPKAEDMLHDLFMKLMEKPEQFNHSRKFSTWVYQVATNMCRNEWRNQNNRSSILQHQASTAAAVSAVSLNEKLDRAFFRERLQQVYAELKEEERLIFVLRFHHELAIKEISDITGTPEGTTKSRIFYMLKKLASQLKTFDPK